MAEGVGIYYSRIQAVTDRVFFQLPPDSGLSDAVSVAVQKHIAPDPVDVLQPQKAVLPYQLRDIDPPYFIVFGIDVHISPFDIFHLETQKLADAHPRSGHEADSEIVQMIAVFYETVLQIFIVCLADDIFQKRFLLNPDHGHPALGQVKGFHQTVHGPDAEIDGLRLIVFHQVAFVEHQVVMAEDVVKTEELLCSKEVGLDSAGSHILKCEILLKILQDSGNGILLET
jgi:hypothetical protein